MTQKMKVFFTEIKRTIIFHRLPIQGVNVDVLSFLRNSWNMSNDRSYHSYYDNKIRKACACILHCFIGSVWKAKTPWQYYWHQNGPHVGNSPHDPLAESSLFHFITCEWETMIMNNLHHIKKSGGICLITKGV